jgi:hypothetical protein
LLFLISIAFITLAAGSPASSVQGAIDEKAYNGTPIVFVFDRDFSPFTYEENGSVYGFELDFLRLLGKEQGFKLIPKTMIWTDAMLSFKKGDADVIGGLVKTEACPGKSRCLRWRKLYDMVQNKAAEYLRHSCIGHREEDESRRRSDSPLVAGVAESDGRVRLSEVW